jgi:23S rRNA C2498 (ribose-2'-O)-methylase RlmM
MRYITKSIRYNLYIALVEWCKEDKGFNYCLEKALKMLCDWCIDYAKWRLSIESKLMAGTNEERIKVVSEEMKKLVNEYEKLVKEYEKMVKEFKDKVKIFFT